jgi:hypothetical protein
MSIKAKIEYLIQIVLRYRNPSKIEKTKILDELCTGYNDHGWECFLIVTNRMFDPYYLPTLYFEL